jgi:hypothetical protein
VEDVVMIAACPTTLLRLVYIMAFTAWCACHAAAWSSTEKK